MNRLRYVELDLRMTRARRDAATLMQILGNLCNDKPSARDLLVTALYKSDVSLRPNDDLASAAKV